MPAVNSKLAEAEVSAASGGASKALLLPLAIVWRHRLLGSLKRFFEAIFRNVKRARMGSESTEERRKAKLERRAKRHKRDLEAALCTVVWLVTRFLVSRKILPRPLALLIIAGLQVRFQMVLPIILMIRWLGPWLLGLHPTAFRGMGGVRIIFMIMLCWLVNNSTATLKPTPMMQSSCTLFDFPQQPILVRCIEHTPRVTDLAEEKADAPTALTVHSPAEEIARATAFLRRQRLAELFRVLHTVPKYALRMLGFYSVLQSGIPFVVRLVALSATRGRKSSPRRELAIVGALKYATRPAVIKNIAGSVWVAMLGRLMTTTSAYWCVPRIEPIDDTPAARAVAAEANRKNFLRMGAYSGLTVAGMALVERLVVPESEGSRNVYVYLASEMCVSVLHAVSGGRGDMAMVGLDMVGGGLIAGNLSKSVLGKLMQL